MHPWEIFFSRWFGGNFAVPAGNTIWWKRNLGNKLFASELLGKARAASRLYVMKPRIISSCFTETCAQDAGHEKCDIVLQSFSRCQIIH